MHINWNSYQVQTTNTYKLGAKLKLKECNSVVTYLQDVLIKLPLSQWQLGCSGSAGNYYLLHRFYKVINLNDKIELICKSEFIESYTYWQKEIRAYESEVYNA